jgi:hypothetical protein
MQSIEDLLTADGVSFAGWHLLSATGISGDGSTIVGFGSDPTLNTQGWIVRYPALQVSPVTNIASAGPQGGPFSPASFQYQLSASTGNLNYLISGIPLWLSANFTSGNVTTTPVTVTFSLINVGNLAPGTYTATVALANNSNGFGSTTRTATLTVNGSLSASPASGPAPLAVKFMTFVAQGDANNYTVNFGDGTSSGPMAVGPSGIACTVNPPCYTGTASTSHIYTSSGSYTATLLNSALATVATASINVTGSGPRVSRSGTGQALPPRGMPLMLPPRPAFGGIATVTGPDSSDDDNYQSAPSFFRE